jgi:tetratricopeptide (TPR) repeat protein
VFRYSARRLEPGRAQRGGVGEAAELAYRQALLEDGPDPESCFNLGNVLFALGRHEQAVERYRQAVELDRDYPEAWNNLGSALEELSQMLVAIKAYRQAIARNSQYPDPYHNLADLLDQMGQAKEAQRLWRFYLRLESTGPWAEYAQRSPRPVRLFQLVQLQAPLECLAAPQRLAHGAISPGLG